MCGRYTLTDVDGHRMAQRYDFDERGIDPATLGRFNVCPTESVLVVTEPEPARRAPLTVRWGLVPRSAQAVGKGSQPINVRSETAAGNRWFGSLMAKGGRCLVPADGWYEWVRGAGRRKQPYFMTTNDGPLVFAGLWAAWGPEPLLTCSIVTVAARGDLALVHSRMPLVLPRSRWATWLAGGGDPADVLAPAPDAYLNSLEIRPVGPAVGDVRNDGPHLVARVAAPPIGAPADVPPVTLSDRTEDMLF
jgi:putative SOS response-associated peptidase YedK